MRVAWRARKHDSYPDRELLPFSAPVEPRRSNCKKAEVSYHEVMFLSSHKISKVDPQKGPRKTEEGCPV